MRLLLAEDSVSLAQSLTQGLTEEGYTVDVVSDGESALHLASELPFDGLISASRGGDASSADLGRELLPVRHRPEIGDLGEARPEQQVLRRGAPPATLAVEHHRAVLLRRQPRR